MIQIIPLPSVTFAPPVFAGWRRSGSDGVFYPAAPYQPSRARRLLDRALGKRWRRVR
jgi:hypothetical protein